MQKLRFSLLLATVCTAFSFFTNAAPALEYGIETPHEAQSVDWEQREAVKNNTAVFSDTLQGTGNAENPFRISGAEDLLYLAEQVNAGHADYIGAYYVQTGDIDLTGLAYTPIGTKEHPFSGSYDGAKYRITYCNSAYEGDVFGVFGYALAADFRNMDIYMELDVTYQKATENSAYVGLLCGRYLAANHCNGTISGCRVDGSITVTNPERTVHAGGMFGTIQARTPYYSDVLVQDCLCSVDVIANAKSSPYVGGIVARAETEGRGKIGFERCYVNGSLAAIGFSNESYSACAGGIAGCLYFDDSEWSQWASLSESVDTGRITATIKDCVVASETLLSDLTKQPSKSTAYVAWLSASVSENVTVQNNYCLQNASVIPNGGNLSITEIASKEELYDYDFLTGTLSFDMDATWTWKQGEALSLRFEETRVIAQRYDSKLIVNPICKENATLVLVYRTPSGTTIETRPVTPETELFAVDIPNGDGQAVSVTVFLLGNNGCKPLAALNRL